MMALQLSMLNMEFELKKIHWLNGKRDNINIILQSKYQIEIAKEAIKICEKQIAYFERLEQIEAKRSPKKKDSSSGQAPIESEKS